VLPQRVARRADQRSVIRRSSADGRFRLRLTRPTILNPSARPTGKTRAALVSARFGARRSGERLAKLPKQRAHKIEFRQRSQCATQCPAPKAKIFRFTSVYQQRICTSSTPPRGVSRSSRTRSWMRWTRLCRKTFGMNRVRSSRVVLAPRCWSQACDWRCRPSARRAAQVMVANKPGTPGRARSSRKTIAQGMPE
jgi:hypothetical protein